MLSPVEFSIGRTALSTNHDSTAWMQEKYYKYIITKYFSQGIIYICGEREREMLIKKQEIEPWMKS